MKSTGARGSIWSTVAVIVGIVAVGTAVAGLLHEPQPDPIAIPGCAEVIQPEDLVRVNYAFLSEGDADISEVPWRFEAKAESMTDALNRGTTHRSDRRSRTVRTDLRVRRARGTAVV